MPDEPIEGMEPAPDWKVSLPEDIRGDKSLEVIKDVPGLAKSFIEAQKMIGGRIPIPTKPEDIEAFKKDHLPKLYQAGVLESVPESPDKYGITKPESLDDGLVKGFLEHAHKTGIPKSQVEKTLNWYADTVKAVTDQHLKDHNTSVEALKKEYGVNYDENVALAQRAVAAYASDSLKKKLDVYGLGDDPDMVKLWVDVAKLRGEDKIIKGSAVSSSGTKEGAIARIEALKKDTEWQAARSNGDAAKQAEWDQLFKTAYT